jgi:Leucine-rich repeat (LRR) protein
MVNAQEYLDKNYPKERRDNITELKIGEKNLEGFLDLQDFINLEFLDCSQNQLTGLDLSKNAKLEVVNVYDNRISCAECAKLDIFSHLVNLLKLDLGFNTDRKLREAEERSSLEQMVQQRGRYSRRVSGTYLTGELALLTRTNESEKSYNDFSGTLEMLRGCQKLKELSIEGQKNIAGELEDLPSSVETLNCKETSFQKKLEGFGHSRNLEILRLT